jgi:Fe2+ or Zn2+ uptake regulation protein
MQPHIHAHDRRRREEPDVHELFNSKGLRCTRQRKAVFEALRSTPAHPTADELYRMVGDRIDGMSLATVYNTLEALCAAGLAQKLPGHGPHGNGSARFDATVDNHLHLRDARTGNVADVPHHLSRALLDHLPRPLLNEIEARLGFKIRQVQIELVGDKA